MSELRNHDHQTHPAPWNTGKKTNDWNYIFSPTGIKIAKCFDPSPAPNHKADGFEIAAANARLIAAAPELLKAIQDLFENFAMVHKHWGDNSNQKQADEAIKAAQQAIRKAAGEQS